MPIEETNQLPIFPVLCLRGLVAFPRMMLTLDIGRKKSIKALNRAMDTNQLIYLVTQKDISVEEPKESDLYKIGCLCKVRQVLKMPDNTVKVLVEGKYKATHKTFADNGSFYVSVIEKCIEEAPKNKEVYIESLIRKIKTEFERYVLASGLNARDIIDTVATSENLSYLCDFIAFNIGAPFDDKQYILEQLAPVNKAKILLKLLDKERQICEIDNRIGEKTRRLIDDNQKEYYLKEQMRAISEELYGDDSADETDRYFDRLEKLNAKNEVKDKIALEIKKLSKMPQGSHEGTVIRGWLDTALSLPFDTLTPVKVDVKKAEKILDRDFYGLKKVKERITEMLSVYALNPDITGQIICLSGPPGVGKTSIGKTIAECMGRAFQRVSLGGMHDEAEIRGHRKTYIGSMPGRIITAIKNAGTSNPLILLDEIDKVGNDYKGDPYSALLEVLDPEQNKTFCDNFLEIPYDLSKVVFITTANSLDTIPAPLLDRMEVIEIDGYTADEKFNIAKKHLVAKELNSHALTKANCRFTDNALKAIIEGYTREAGVRKLQRCIASVCGKVAKKIAFSECEKYTVRDTDLEGMLGKKKYKSERILENDTVGIINGLAWTRVGGEIMQMEVVTLKGSGKTVFTGSLGDVMKESCEAAVTFVRANAEKYGIDVDFYKNTDIHIHATEAATPKDGPSAGVTITTALVSALTGREVKRDVAMTGEITVKGRVLPIGGLKEKAMAAYIGGVKRVFIPRDNIPDLLEVDKTVREGLEFIPVSFVGEIIDNALVFTCEEKEKKDDFTHSLMREKVTVSRC